MLRRQILHLEAAPDKYQEAPLKETSMPFPPIPAIKHWNPHDSKSAITLSTTVPDNTEP